MTKIDSISCVIIAKNAQRTLSDTLNSLSTFEDVILYSNNSSDDTDSIAKSFKNVTLVQGDFLGFGETKNRAASYAKNEWVLSLDADEVLSQEFLTNLQNLQLNESTIYSIERENYYKEQHISHCWGNDIIPRLYKKTLTSFTNKKVHESIISEAFTLQKLKGVVRHYPYSNISDFIQKLDSYSTIYAQDNRAKKISSPSKAFFNGLFSFFKTYILKRGFLDGYAGLLISFSHMATNFYKYLKLYESNQELK